MSYPQDIFKRATNYLYNKETRSSYEIEKEKPSLDRMEKFVALLVKAGLEPIEKMLEKQRLLQMQNAIVDERFAATDFSDFQNFVGESLRIKLSSTLRRSKKRITTDSRYAG